MRAALAAPAELAAGDGSPPRAVELAAFDPREGSDADPPAPVHRRPHRWGWLAWLPWLVVEAVRAGPARPRVLWLAALLRRRGVAQAHVHFAGEAAADTRLACARVGIPYSVTVHAADLFKPHPALPAILRDAAAVATISEHNQRVLSESYGAAARLVRCGVRVRSGSPRDAGAALPAGPPRVLAVGRWVPKKGLDLYAALPARIAGATFELVSDAPPLPGVDVLGLLPHADVLARIAGAALLVLPCRRAPDGDLDGIPVVLLEALAAGVPVVTTPVSGIPEVVDEAVGWLVPPDDIDALAAAVAAALADPEEARRRGARGPERLVERGFARDDATRAALAVLERARSR